MDFGVDWWVSNWLERYNLLSNKLFISLYNILNWFVFELNRLDLEGEVLNKRLGLFPDR